MYRVERNGQNGLIIDVNLNQFLAALVIYTSRMQCNTESSIRIFAFVAVLNEACFEKVP